MNGFCTCDGRDLRAQLATNSGGPAAPENLRHAMCGQYTKNTTAVPVNAPRYLLSGAGSVGRCVDPHGASCATDLDCVDAMNNPTGVCIGDSWNGASWTGGRCTGRPDAGSSCNTDLQIDRYAICLGGKWRNGPPCVGDSDCDSLFGASDPSSCIGKTATWCRNKPDSPCTKNADCQTCTDCCGMTPTMTPLYPFSYPVPCGALCEPRRLKLFVDAASSQTLLTDLALDPDESGAGRQAMPTPAQNTTMKSMSTSYQTLRTDLTCCIDKWSSPNSSCPTCPTGFTCNR